MVCVADRAWFFATLAKKVKYSSFDQAHLKLIGRKPEETVTAIRTFTGQAFQAPPAAEPLLVVPSTFIALMPRVAWQFRT